MNLAQTKTDEGTGERKLRCNRGRWAPQEPDVWSWLRNAPRQGEASSNYH